MSASNVTYDRVSLSVPLFVRACVCVCVFYKSPIFFQDGGFEWESIFLSLFLFFFSSFSLRERLVSYSVSS